MKKITAILSATLAIVAFASCNKEDIDTSVNVPTEGNIPFVLNAEIPQTKVAFGNDWSLSWETGDIVYAVTSDEEWGVAYDNNNPETESIAEFVYNGASFITSKTISDGNHTFNFLYAPESQKSYHRGASTTYSIPAMQQQDCSVPTANLKGYYPLAGQVTVNTPADAINVQMSHLATIVKVTLKNKTGKDVSVCKFSIDMPETWISGIYNVVFGENPSISQKSGNMYNSTIGVGLNSGTIAAGADLPVYIVMAPVSEYNGDITFTAESSNGWICSKTNTVSGVTFAPGTYNEASFTMKEFVVPSETTFDLTIDETVEATESRLSWSSPLATMKVERGESTAATNNYYPGVGNSSTRMYKNSVFSMSPVTGVTLSKVVFVATTTNYAAALAGSDWANASAAADGTTVTVVPANGAENVSAIITNTVGLTSVTVYSGEAVAPLATITADSNLNIPYENAEGSITPVYTNTKDVSVKVYSNNQLTEECDWLVAEVKSDFSIDYLAEDNDGEERTAYIVINAKNSEAANTRFVIKVTQDAYVDPNAPVTVTFTMGTGKDMSSNSAVTKGYITIAATDGSSTVNNWGGTTYVRLQAGGTVIITPKNNATITSVVMNCTSGYEKTWSSSTGNAPEVNSTSHTVTWTGSTSSAITLKNTATAQARISTIEVTYTNPTQL